MKKLGQLLEDFDQVKADELSTRLGEAQDTLRQVVQDLQDIEKDIRKNGDSSTAERLKSYIIGHLKTLIDKDSGYMSQDINLEDIKNAVSH